MRTNLAPPLLREGVAVGVLLVSRAEVHLAKIEAGRMELEAADFHLPQAIDDALVLVRERALRRGIALTRWIAQGYATIAAIGFRGRWDYGAIGTVTNLAARLCGEARPGQILVSRRLHAALEDLVEAAPVGELALKGFARPVSVYNVTGLTRA